MIPSFFLYRGRHAPPPPTRQSREGPTPTRGRFAALSGTNFRAVVLGAALCALASAARAQGFDVQHFKPTPDQQEGYFTLHAARALDPGAFEIGIVADYARNPLVLVDDTGARVQRIVSDQLVGDALFAIGVLPRLQLGLDLPVVLLQKGDPSTSRSVPDASGAGLGLGDIVVMSKLALVQPSSAVHPSGFGLALVLAASLPTGDRAVFQGERLRIEPRAVVDYVWASGVRIGAQVGYLVRPKTALLEAEINDELTAGIGAGVPLDSGRKFHVLGEATMRVGVLAGHIDRSELPIELTAGGRYFHPSGVMFEVGVGTGLNAGVGSPDYRLIAGVTYRHDRDHDPDHDGLVEPADLCPNAAEDKDGFEDGDGCPDPDNDRDGIPDGVDRCPNQAEDRDHFEDDDGCPDPDNDKDGIADTSDRCPNEAEDKDGFEDDDGCPDPDNDQDGVADANDRCPNEPEDKDGFEDDDGCPDPDNDKDGIADAKDRCPNEAEDFDGFEDGDGCPEAGTGLVKLTCDSIEIHDRVYFANDKDRIESRSFGLLDQVASVLKAATQVKRIRIEGHTDDRGNDQHNLELSQRRAAAVQRYLIDHGVEATRLEAQGFGEQQPIAENKTAAGRTQNRRVQFAITQRDAKCTTP